ncbi:MAG: CRISPR-associated endonuclease Cas1, partial [Candidatus Hydrogenedens sp.]
MCRYKTYLAQIEDTLHNTIYPLIEKLKSINTENISHAKQQIMSTEAHASSIYWSYFKQLISANYNFTHRTHRHSKDPVNSALNYGYGILYSECFRALTLAGLDPYAGFLHTLQNNK